MTIVLGGLGSAIYLASHGVDASSPVAGLVESGRAADQVAGELACALGFTERTTTAVTFTVADRNGDGQPETLRYAWSGTAGDPLTRQYNGGTVVTMLPEVAEFALAYDVLVETQEVPGAQVEGDEVLLLSHTASGGTLKEFKFESNKYVGECFLPALPAEASAWSITRVKFLAKADGPTTGVTAVQIRRASATHGPTSTVLEELWLYESNLTGEMTWQEFFFGSVAGLAPTEETCLVLKHSSGTVAGRAQYEQGGVDTPEGVMVTTSSGGFWWNVSTTNDLILYVYGTVTSPGPPEIVPIAYHLRAVNLRLRVGPEASAAVQTAVQVLNKPQVSNP